jgi:hypothetical protein
LTKFLSFWSDAVKLWICNKHLTKLNYLNESITLFILFDIFINIYVLYIIETTFISLIFQNTINTDLRLKILLVIGEFLAFEYAFIEFIKNQIWWLLGFVQQKSNRFSVHNNHSNLCMHLVNSQWLMVSRKTCI